MTFEEYKEKYRGMSSVAVRELIRSDAFFRNETEKHYTQIYRKKLNKSCGDCWFDAYIVLMNTNPEKAKAMKEKKFDLRAGAILTDVVNRDPAKTCSHHNLTDELALYHLSTNPSYIKFFSIYPDNWAELVMEYSLPKKTQQDAAEHVTKPIDEVKAEAPKATAPKTTKKSNKRKK
jgi:hypothetical protein